jgi:hypothetical protein
VSLKLRADAADEPRDAENAVLKGNSNVLVR